MITLWVLVLSVFIMTSGVESIGCPIYSVQKNFNVSQYLGKWYQHGSINTESFQGKGKCIFARYDTTPDRNVISVYNEQINLSSNKVETLDGSARLENPLSGEGKLIVTFPLRWFKVSGPYWVLNTDYTSYAIVSGCHAKFWLFRSPSFWILTRHRVVKNQTTIAKVKAALVPHNLKYTDFKLTNQKDCPKNLLV